MLAEATDRVNKEQTDRIIYLLKQKLSSVKGKKVAILGLTYKPNTDVIEESASIEIAKALVREGALVAVYDPAGMEEAKKVLEKGIKYTNSVRQCLEDAELAIMAVPWDEFKDLKPQDFIETMRSPVVLDCWRVFSRSEFSQRLKYLAIGLSLT